MAGTGLALAWKAADRQGTLGTQAQADSFRRSNISNLCLPERHGYAAVQNAFPLSWIATISLALRL